MSIALDQPENVWKAYIDLEVTVGNLEAANALFERLLAKTKHVKVWLGFAWHMLDQAHSVEGARKVLARANLHFKDKEPDLKEERLMLLENWLQIEQKAGSSAAVIEDVKAKFPKRVKKRRKIKVVDTATG